MKVEIVAALSLSFVASIFPEYSLAAERPSTNELLRQGYTPIAAGHLTMKRVFVVEPGWTGFATGDDLIVSMPAEGKVPHGELKAILGRQGAFLRLTHNAEEYVCILHKTDTCYRVTADRAD